MTQFLIILTFVTIGIVLLWLGISFFTRSSSKIHRRVSNERQSKTEDKPDFLKPRTRKSSTGEGNPNKTCPVCSAELSKSELVSSSAFPSADGAKDRVMHIRGCVYCLNGERERVCPVCGAVLEKDEILIARLFERAGRRSHIHVIGCTRCRKGPRSGR